MPKKGRTAKSGGARDTKPRRLLHALSEIEQFSVAEKEGSPIPEEAVNTDELRSFFTVGLETAVVCTVSTALLSPFMFAAKNGLVPVFGSYEFTVFDKAFIVLSTVSFPLACSLLVFFVLRRLYVGNVTRKMIDSLVRGLVSGTLFSITVAVILYHILYYMYLTPEVLSELFQSIPEEVRPGYRVYSWLTQFGNHLIPGAYFQAAVNLASAAIVVSGVVLGRIKTARTKELKKMWD